MDTCYVYVYVYTDIYLYIHRCIHTHTQIIRTIRVSETSPGVGAFADITASRSSQKLLKCFL